MANHPPSTTPLAPPRPSPPPHILRIPGEIRNQIYENLIVFPRAVAIYREASNNALSAALLAVFLTCRQFHHEASPIFYSRNRFALPRTASRAPHQMQANLLFRWFLDRVGPRNAVLLRHLAVPFPVDPAEFMRAHFASSTFACQYDGDDKRWGWSCCRSLVPALAERCPGLEKVEFDMRWNNHWVRLLSPNPSTVLAMFGQLDEALRTAFPALKRIGLRLVDSEREPRWTVTGEGLRASADMSRKEWRWVRRTLQQRLGWSVTLGQEEEEGQEHEGETPSWTSTWYPNNARHPRSLLLLPPEMALRSEKGDRYTGLDRLKANVRFALAWLRSPSKIVYSDTEAGEWREWRDIMKGRAQRTGAPP
jgi:hypothetical protein